MEIFDFTDYRKYIDAKIKTYPQNGYGIQSKLAEALGMHSSFLSSMLKSERQLTPEHALNITQFFELAQNEKDYFIEMVNYDRAGTQPLKEYYRQKLADLREKSHHLKESSPNEKELSDTEKAIYYSDWKYAAIRIACFLPDMTAVRISDTLDIPLETTERILLFLKTHGLVTEKSGTFCPGHSIVRVKADSSLVYRHHANWRNKAIASFDTESSKNMHNTVVFSLSADDAENFKKLLKKSIENSLKNVEDSKSEQLWCLCLDLFRFERGG